MERIIIVQKFKTFSKLILFSLFLCPLYGQDFYVNKSGSDANSCATASGTTDTDAKLTIQAGINCLTEDASEELEVGPGTYIEEILRGDWVNGDNSWATATKITGESGQTAIIKPAAGAEYALEFVGNWVIWDNIDLDCTNVSSQCVSIRSLSSVKTHHFRITNSELYDGPSNGIGFFSDTPLPDNVEIIDNVIRGFGLVADSEGFTCQFHGVYLSKSNNLVEGNTIRNGNGHGIQVFHADDAPGDNVIRENILRDNLCNGIRGMSGDRNKVYNNVIYDNTLIGIRSGVGNDTEFYNNTLFRNGAGCFVLTNSSSGTIIENNICWKNGPDTIQNVNHTSVTIANNLVAVDPLFVSETEGSEDLKLTSGSSAIDTGLLQSLFTSDIDGIIVRSDEGVAWDIGAYEFDQSGTPPTPPSGCGSGDAITQTELIAAVFDDVDRSTYTTPSVSPSDNALQVITIFSRDSDTVPPDIPVVAGFNTLITVVVSTNRRVTKLRRLETTATSGTLDITFATDPQDWIIYQMSEYPNVDIGGSNGASAVLQSTSQAVSVTTSCTATLDAFGHANNATIGAIGVTSVKTQTQGTGFTLISQDDTVIDGHTLAVEWRDDNDTTVDFSWTGNAGATCIAAELVRSTAAACGGSDFGKQSLGTSF